MENPLKKIYFLIISLFITGFALAQSVATSLWPLIADQSAEVTGNILAFPQSLSNIQVKYESSVQRSSPSGTAGSWPGETTENSSRYIQFAVTPEAGYIFNVTSIVLMLYVNSGSGMRANIYYSADPFFSSKTQVGSTFTLGKSVPSTPNVAADFNHEVSYGDTFYVRIYPWYTESTTGKYVIAKDVTVSGTSMPSTSIIVAPVSLSGFIQADAATPSAPQTYSLSGMNLTDTVVIIPPPEFDISADDGSIWTGYGDSISLPVTDGAITGQPVNIAVRLNTTAAGPYEGIISHRSAGANGAEVTLAGVCLAAEPTNPSTIVIDSLTGTTIALAFVGGNGLLRIVAIRAGSDISWLPEDGKAVAGVSANFTEAPDQGDGTKIVCAGADTSVTVSGLTSNTTYTVAVFEYNVATGNSQNYLTTSFGVATFTTPAVPTLSATPGSLDFGSVLFAREVVKSYALSGNFLNENDTIKINSATGFDISSIPDSGFGPSLQIPYSGLTVSAIIYVRFLPAAPGVYSGVIDHSGGGTSINVTVTGTCVETTPSPMEMIGYATVSAEGYTTTTGGAGGTVTTVSTLAELLAFASNCEDNFDLKILCISGKISASSSTVVTIKHGANISILGEGSTAELENIGLNIRDYHNVIIRNLRIHEVLYPNDAITIDACHHVWIDHNELYSKIGADIGVDTYDGLLDIKEGSRYVTVSWNYLHHHMKCSLIGHTDKTDQQATDSQMRITYHHNWFSYTEGRNPSIRFGAIHMFNNYFEEITDYGIAARNGAHAKLENNHYHNVILPMSTDKFPTAFPNGYICESGNIFTGTCGSNVISQTGCDFWNSTSLPYSYVLDPVESVESIVKLNAGISDTTDTVTREADFVTPTNILLIHNYPNPFNSATTILFSVPVGGYIAIKIYDLLGRQIVTLYDEIAEAGVIYRKIFNAERLAGGIYFCSLETAGGSTICKMLLLK